MGQYKGLILRAMIICVEEWEVLIPKPSCSSGKGSVARINSSHENSAGAFRYAVIPSSKAINFLHLCASFSTNLFKRRNLKSFSKIRSPRGVLDASG